jgi:PleD family two-component response regulator
MLRMGVSPPRVLIAGLVPVMRAVQQALAADTETLSAESYDHAQRLLNEERPDAVVVAYHFDEIRPVRLIRYMREDPKFAKMPILLVRVLPISLGATEEEMRGAYRALGVNDFFNLADEAQVHGEQAALDRLRDRVRAVLLAKV